MALPPVASIVAMDMEMLNIGKTIFSEESALLPIKRDMNIPSIIVYSDINNIIIMLGIANFNNLTGVKCWIQAGGAHHTVLSTAVTAEMMQDWAEMMQIECVHITANTTVEEFKKELFYNDIAWKLKNI